jgi:hypothetical protein
MRECVGESGWESGMGCDIGGVDSLSGGHRRDVLTLMTPRTQIASQGGHLVKRLQKEGYWVRGVDIKRHEYFETDPGDEFLIADMRDRTVLTPPPPPPPLFPRPSSGPVCLCPHIRLSRLTPRNTFTPSSLPPTLLPAGIVPFAALG